VLMVVNGILLPKTSALCGGFITLGRIVYGIGYALKGPDGRLPGAIIAHLGDFPLFILSFYTGAAMLGWVNKK